MNRLTSPDNPKIRHVARLLESRRERSKTGRAVAEGFRLVEDALTADARFAFILVADDVAGADPGFRSNQGAKDAGPPQSSAIPDLLHRLESVAPVFSVPAELLASVSDTETPQGIVAVVEWDPGGEGPSAPTLVVALDGVQDPGNAGSILRTAAAAGADGVVALRGTVDLWNPKTVRSGMGAHFRLPSLSTTWERWPTDWQADVVVADADGTAVYTEWDWSRPTALVIGSEAHGASQAALDRSVATLRIPMARETESINAAAAAAVMLFEAARQRRREPE